MNKEISELLRELAAKLGTTVDHLYAVLIRQAWVAALQDFLFLLAVSLLWWFIYRTIKRKYAPDQEEQKRSSYYTPDDWTDEPGPTIAMVLMGLVWLVCIGCTCYSVVQALANPEYYAIHEIVSALK